MFYKLCIFIWTNTYFESSSFVYDSVPLELSLVPAVFCINSKFSNLVYINYLKLYYLLNPKLIFLM